jgi:hypothetical protein
MFDSACSDAFAVRSEAGMWIFLAVVKPLFSFSSLRLESY